MTDFKFKINYNECITNVACSILKYFNCNYYHNTIPILDEILNKKKPKNVILLLFDGLGSRILDKVLDKDSFLIKNRIKEITSVFPSTTASSTLSAQTGLNPVEHGWLGWTNYISPIDSIIQLFWDVEKGESPKNDKNEEFLKIKQKNLSPKLLVDLIKEKDCDTYAISPYSEYKYKTLNQMFTTIKEKLDINNGKKKFMYVYNNEPDSSMHRYGCDSQEAIKLILERNKKLEEFYNKNLDKETIMIIVADHGHLNADNISLKNYTDINNLMMRSTWVEERCPMFKIKEGKQNEFKKLFEKYFGNYFYLLTKEEIEDKQIFGDIKFKKNELFDSSLEDFIAINKENCNKTLLDDNDFQMMSVHGGNTDDEIYIPLIILNK
jgi:predicted AlkP superfamily pyrophosphatase or phosphodiesterase